MEEERRWEDLQTDCLINIFARVDTKTLAKSVQFVCKSWYHTTLIPQCWFSLGFKEGLSSSFLQYAVDRSTNAATSVIFDIDINDECLMCIAQCCPLLKVLHLPYIEDDNSLISGVIPNWKNLECIRICSLRSYTETLTSISLHCKNFRQLSLCGINIWDEEALLIGQLLPKIEVLKLFHCHFTRLGLETMLKSMNGLNFFDVSECDGYDEINVDEMQKLARGINYFNFSGYTRFGKPGCGTDSEDDEDYAGEDDEDFASEDNEDGEDDENFAGEDNEEEDGEDDEDDDDGVDDDDCEDYASEDGEEFASEVGVDDDEDYASEDGEEFASEVGGGDEVYASEDDEDYASEVGGDDEVCASEAGENDEVYASEDGEDCEDYYRKDDEDCDHEDDEDYDREDNGDCF